MEKLEDKVKETMRQTHIIYQNLFPLVERLEKNGGYTLGEERCWIYSHFAKKAFEHLGFEVQIASGGFVTEPETKKRRKKPTVKKLNCLLSYEDLSQCKKTSSNGKNLVKFKDFFPHHWIKLKIDDRWYAVDILLSSEETETKEIMQPVCYFMHLGKNNKKSYYPYDEQLEGFKVLSQKSFIGKYFGDSREDYNELLYELIYNTEGALG